MGEYETLDVGGRAVRLTSPAIYAGAPGVVVLHAWWGLNDDVIAYADRLAAAGFAVVAPDMFGGQVAATIEDAERLSGAAESPDTKPSVESIALAAVDDLAMRLGPTSRLGVLGFSFGAAYATLIPADGIGSSRRSSTRRHTGPHQTVVRRGPRPLRGERPV
jgi:carboxymethylenebutenolidase